MQFGYWFETAKHLCKAGADIVVVCRSFAKAEDAAKELRGVFTGQIEGVELDLDDHGLVRGAADTIRKTHHKIGALINYASILRTLEQETDGVSERFVR